MAIDIMRCYTETPPVRDYILPSLLPGTVGSIVSPGGTGKSMLALQLAHCIAGFDVDLLGLGKLNHGRVGYLSAEDGGDVLHERLHAIGAKLNQEQRECCAEFMLVEDLTRHTPDLNDPRWLEFLERYAAQCRLLFIDTLRSFHSGDENSGNEMAVLIGNLRAIAARTGAALVFLHHSSKAAALSGNGDVQQASRGSSVLTDNIRWQSFLAGMSKDEADDYGVSQDRRGYYVRFGISKQNYGAPFDEKWYFRGQGGVLEPVAAPVKNNKGGHDGYAG